MANEVLRHHLYSVKDAGKWDETIFDGMDDAGVESVLNMFEKDAETTGEDPDIGFTLAEV